MMMMMNIMMNIMYILALEMASLGNEHCANCIGTLSFPISVPPPFA